MSQITCPECKKQISESSNVCPNCGYPISSSVATHNEETKLIIKCPDCGNVISDKSNPCPNCACPPDCFVKVEQTEQKEGTPKKDRMWLLFTLILLLALFVGAHFINQAMEQQKQEEYQRKQEEYRRQQEEERIQQEIEQEAREREAREREARMARLEEYVSGETFGKMEWIDNYTSFVYELYLASNGLGLEKSYEESMYHGITWRSNNPISWRITMDGELKVVYDTKGNYYIFSIDTGNDCIIWGDDKYYRR